MAAEPQALVAQDAPSGDLTKYGNVPIPRTADQLMKLLEWSKTDELRKAPLVIRASHLPDDMKDLLYHWNGLPAAINPAEVMIFAGRAYPSANGAIQAALSDPRVTHLSARQVASVACKDPASGCTSIRSADTDRTVVYEATLRLDGKEFQVEHRACPHTTFAKDRLAKVAQTRALRTVCVPIIGEAMIGADWEDAPADATGGDEV